MDSAEGTLLGFLKPDSCLLYGTVVLGFKEQMPTCDLYEYLEYYIVDVKGMLYS